MFVKNLNGLDSCSDVDKILMRDHIHKNLRGNLHPSSPILRRSRSLDHTLCGAASDLGRLRIRPATRRPVRPYRRSLLTEEHENTFQYLTWHRLDFLFRLCHHYTMLVEINGFSRLTPGTHHSFFLFSHHYLCIVVCGVAK